LSLLLLRTSAPLAAVSTVAAGGGGRRLGSFGGLGLVQFVQLLLRQPTLIPVFAVKCIKLIKNVQK
jgi:hypothetical protein